MNLVLQVQNILKIVRPTQLANKLVHGLYTQSRSDWQKGGSYMTANQINFLRVQEDRRSHLASESEARRHNLASEDIGRGQIGLGYSQLSETARHNTVSEGINMYDATGRVVSSMRQASAAERRAATSDKQQQEQARHNKTVEAETQRHNLRDEYFTRRGQTQSYVTGLLNAAARSVVPLVYGGGVSSVKAGTKAK